MTINVILSDVTYMKDDKYCIAGYDPYARKMRRLMPDGHHWKDEDVENLKQYSYIKVNALQSLEGCDYPHRTEDIAIDSASLTVLKTYDRPKELVDELKDTVSKTVKSIFNGHLKDNTYVPPKTRCPSLGAVVIPSADLTFYRDGEKLRIKFKDYDKEEYDLRVTCKYLRDVLDKEKSLDGLNEELKQYGKAHIRVGLANPYYKQNNNCFLMCNGVFFF